MKKLNKILSLLIALVMVIGLLPFSAFAVVTGETSGATGPDGADYAAVLRENAPGQIAGEGVTITEIANPGVDLRSGGQTVEKLETAGYEDDEIVRVIVILKDKSLLSQGFTVDQISGGAAAAARAAGTIEAGQDAIVAEIGKVVRGLGIRGADTEITAKYRYSIAVNGLAVEVPYGALDGIRALDGVETAFVAAQYELPETVDADTLQPYTSSTSQNFGSAQTWDELGYTGAGMRIAIIDTGIDPDHPSFTDAPALTDTSLTEEEVGSVLPTLNAYQRYEGLTAADVHVSEKIPFAFNYVDEDLDVTHDLDGVSDHGSHVAGIAAANKIDTTSVVGVAPDAQLIVMKVFGKNGGAYSDDVLAALEDCIRLNVDVVNMSLGSPAGFTAPEAGSYLDYYLSEIEESGMIVAVAAGNEYSAPYGSPLGQALGNLFKNFTTDPDNGIVAVPGISSSAITVASWENSSYMANYIALGETEILYYDATYAFVAQMAPDGATEYEYVMVPGLGEAQDYEGIDVTGRIAVVQRGSIAFTEKQINAYYAGAAACIVYDNEYSAALIYMQNSGALPNVFISRADGEALAAAVDPETGVGRLTVMGAGDLINVPSPTAGQMSDFSSWGVTPDLQLAPEVTAPGGNIYSCYTDGQYGMMDGTSMATPHIAGMSALVLQHLNAAYGLTGEQARTAADALIMSTAVPVTEYEYSGISVPYSPRKQGAGLANVYSAVTSPAYLTVGGSTPKVSFGDDDKKTGSYTFSFEVNNLSDEAVIYALDSSVLTDYVLNYGAPYIFMGEESLPLDAEVSYSFIGSDDTFREYDVNGDGVFDRADVQFALDAANGVEKTVISDVNGDGVFNTADAQYLLEMLAALPNPETAHIITVPGGESVIVTVNIKLTEDDKAYMDYFYPNGIYVDGFIRLLSMSGDAADLSLPFMGFYGDWSAAKVFGDTWSYEEDVEIPERYWNVIFTNFGSSSYTLGSNPYIEDEEYDPAHNVLSPNGDGYQDYIDDVYVAMMRNAKTLEFTWVNQYGLPLYASSVDYVRKSYYNNSQGLMLPFVYSWYIDGIYDYSGTSDGDRVTLFIDGYLDDGDSFVDETLEIPMVIDTVKPQLLGGELLYDAETDTRTLRLSVSDNYDIAAVIPLTMVGDPYEYFAVNTKAEGDEGETAVIDIDVSGYDASFMIAVCDYGCNEAYYEVTFEGVNNISFDKFYGYRQYSTVSFTYNGQRYLMPTENYNGWYSFSEPGSMVMHTDAYSSGETCVAAAEYIDGYVIGVDENGSIFGSKAGDWSNRTVIGTLELDGELYPALDMAFDYTTNTLYILTDELSSGWGGHLVKMDYLTGELTDLGVIGGMEYGSQPMTLACDNSGTLYTVNYSAWADYGYESGVLYTIGVEYDEEWGETYVTATRVGDTGYRPRYYQSMTVDHATNELYWAAYQGYTGSSALYQVDKATGELAAVGAMEYNGEMTALFKPFKAPTPLYPTGAVELESLALSADSLTMAAGTAKQLVSRPLPYYAEITGTVAWSSSDETVAVVDENGVVTAVGEGNATVTAELDGKTAQCAVRVVAVDADLYVYDAGSSYMWLNLNANAPGDAAYVEDGIQPDNYDAFFLAAAYTVDGVAYAFDSVGGFYRFDAETMQGVRLGTNNAMDGYEGMMMALAFSPADGHLYGIAQTGSYWESYYSLVRVNPNNGETLVLGDLSDYMPRNLAVAPDGTFYCVADVPDYETYTYATSVMSFTLDGNDGIGEITTVPVKGFEAYGGSSSLVYSAENKGLFWADYNGALLWIDPATGDNINLGGIGSTADYYPSNVCLFEVPAADPEVTFPKPERVDMADSFLLVAGGSVSANVTLQPWNARAEISYAIADPGVATVDAGGVITGVAAGATTLTVTVGEESLTAAVTVAPSAGTLYGNVISSDYGGNFWVAIPDASPEDAAVLYYADEGDFAPYAGAYWNGSLYLYAQEQENEYDFYLLKMDPAAYTYEVIGQVHETIRDMEFDYTTGVMYAVVDTGVANGALAQVDLETAEVCVIGDTGLRLCAMTVDDEGNIYAINEDGGLYQIDKETAQATLVGDTGADGAGMSQSMHFDLNSGNTYWAKSAGTSSDGLYLVDLTTGASTRLGAIGSGAQLCAMYTVPEAEPEAPAVVEANGVVLTEKAAVVAGETVSLRAAVLPLSVAEVTGELTWASSDEGVATVDNGVVTGVSAGTAVITATVNGVTASCTVTVTAEARRFYAYDETNAQWISFTDGSDVTVERVDAEGEETIAASAYVEGKLYSYTADGFFWSVDPETFERTYIGEGVSGTTVTATAFDYWSGSYEVETSITPIDLSYDEAAGKLYGLFIAYDTDGWWLRALICEIDPETGAAAEVYSSDGFRPGNLLVKNGRAFFVDTLWSGILSYVDLGEPGAETMQHALVQNYWGDPEGGRSFIEDPLTGAIYVLRDNQGGMTSLWTMDLKDAYVTPLTDVIGEGSVLNSLFLR